MRRALQLSLNVPAVAVLDRGRRRAGLRARLTQAGGALVLPTGEAPGLAMGLGGVGVTLADLTMLYAGLRAAAIGDAAASSARDAAEPRGRARLLDPVAAWYVGNILLGTPPPDNAPRGRIAFKTGTSYGYRDAWAVGFDGAHTIGVWVGRPDGAPVPGLVGRAAAAPILFDAFARTGKRRRRLPHAPQGRVFATTAKLPPPLQRFRPAALRRRQRAAAHHVPAQRRAARACAGGGKPDPVALKVAGGAGPLTVLVNGLPLAAQARPAHAVLPPGRSRLRAAHGDGCPRRDRQRHGAPAVAAAHSRCAAARRLLSSRRGQFAMVRLRFPDQGNDDDQSSDAPAHGASAPRV